MSCEAEIHLGDVGTIFRVTLKDKACDGTSSVLDASSGNPINMIFKAPSGAKKTMSAVFTTNGTDGQIEYVTIADDLDEVGNWKLQIYIVMPSGNWNSDIGSFYVYENL